MIRVMEALLTPEIAQAHTRNARIRTARHGDRREVVDLIDAVAAERQHLQTNQYRSTPAWERLLSEGISCQDGFILLVAEQDEQVVGFARLIAGTNGPKDRHVGNIGIAVRRECRRRGVGSLLLRNLIRMAPKLGCSKLTAEVIASNTASRRLFKKFGFLVEGVRRRQYRIGTDYVDEVLLATWLTTEH